MGKRIRTSFDITPAMDETISEIAEELGITKAEVFRRAIALMDLSVEASKSGQHIGFTDKMEDLKTVVAGIA